MEGYSVTDAASVLGVPTERVWELLARGILAGRPEGESGMRVFLQPRPASASSTMEMPPPTPPPAREPERELSPFRELLTEFRNLTERYGQALLALGEARGEVASLRSRVDLLEARMDLRLPMGAAVAGPPIGWESPARPMFEPSLEPSLPSNAEPVEEVASAAEPAVATEPPLAEERAPAEESAVADERADAEEPLLEADQERTEADEEPGETVEAPEQTADEPDEGADRQRRRRNAHHATESFAEALARAEDPTVPELPEPHREPLAEAAADGGLPRELPAAEPIPTADDQPSAESMAVEQPAPSLAAHSFVGEPAGEGSEVSSEEAASSAEAVTPDDLAGEGEPTVAREPEPAWPAVDGDAEMPALDAARADHWPDHGGVDEEDFGADLDASEESGAAEPGMADAGASDGPRAEESTGRPEAPLVWDPERYTTAIGEPDWYAEDERLEAPSAGPDGGEEGTTAAADLRPDRTEEEQEEHPAAAAVPEPASGVAASDGSSEMEVAASGHGSEPDSDAEAGQAPLGGGAEDALAALDALGRSVGPDAVAPHPPSWAAPAGDAAGVSRPLDPVAEYRSGAIGSVRPTTTPATRAYRRLRRIFPG